MPLPPMLDLEQTAKQLQLLDQHHLEWVEHSKQRKEGWEALKRAHIEQRNELATRPHSALEKAALLIKQADNIVDWYRLATDKRNSILTRHRAEMTALEQERWA